jgi:large subunit ribosomal protein L9
MKVILNKDVAKVGRRGEIKDLSDGYARNFILARGLGVLATEAAVAKLATEKQNRERLAEASAERVAEILKNYEQEPLLLIAPANAQGHLFAGFHAADIARALAKEKRGALPETALHLSAPLKTVGEHEVPVKTAGHAGRLKVLIRAAKSA